MYNVTIGFATCVILVKRASMLGSSPNNDSLPTFLQNFSKFTFYQSECFFCFLSSFPKNISEIFALHKL